MKPKDWLIITVTIAIEAAITFFAANKFSVRFIEVMFFIGLACTIIIYYFSSSGGRASEIRSAQLRDETGYIQKSEPFVFKRGPVFNASILYLLIGLLLFILLISGVIPPAGN
ncbi:hypothetical protein M3603_07635 [Rummeliibacillus stabekisii]|uniref:hypothetical protein n=1 Tax=Rummeliibacillus stabekisii TaxID=241244 RepID=UPI002040B204|nr:hypothetical protein [Rummeliibacillus stabekisii]MCM3316549.1 hypothetical protein [Rummeliibacillus stabekisii]